VRRRRRVVIVRGLKKYGRLKAIPGQAYRRMIVVGIIVGVTVSTAVRAKRVVVLCGGNDDEERIDYDTKTSPSHSGKRLQLR
jgi:hypothetical protein